MRIKSSRTIAAAIVVASFAATSSATELLYLRCVGETADRLLFSHNKNVIDNIFEIDPAADKISYYDSKEYEFRGGLGWGRCGGEAVSCEISRTEIKANKYYRDRGEPGRPSQYYRFTANISRLDGSYEVAHEYSNWLGVSGKMTWRGQCSRVNKPEPPKTKF